MHDPLVVAIEIRRPWPRRQARLGPDTRRWSFGRHHANPGSPAEEQGRGKFGGAFPWWKPSSYSPFWILAGRHYYWPSLITIWHREPGGADSGTVCKIWGSSRWRFHFWHWHIQVSPALHFKRWAWSRCAECGRRFPWNYSPVCHQWNGGGPKWFKSETDTYHHECSNLVHLRLRIERDHSTIRELFAYAMLESHQAEMILVNRLCGSGSGWDFLQKRDLAHLLGYEMDSSGTWIKKRADADVR